MEIRNRYGFVTCIPPQDASVRKHTSRIETFKEGEGKCVSEVYTEECDCLVLFSNESYKVMTMLYTEFRHNIKKPEDKTIISWHWKDHSLTNETIEAITPLKVK